LLRLASFLLLKATASQSRRELAQLPAADASCRSGATTARVDTSAAVALTEQQDCMACPLAGSSVPRFIHDRSHL